LIERQRIQRNINVFAKKRLEGSSGKVIAQGQTRENVIQKNIFKHCLVSWIEKRPKEFGVLVQGIIGRCEQSERT